MMDAKRSASPGAFGRRKREAKRPACPGPLEEKVQELIRVRGLIAAVESKASPGRRGPLTGGGI